MKRSISRKITSVGLILMLVMSSFVLGFAEDGQDSVAPEKSVAEESAEKDASEVKEPPKQEAAEAAQEAPQVQEEAVQKEDSPEKEQPEEAAEAKSKKGQKGNQEESDNAQPSNGKQAPPKSKNAEKRAGVTPADGVYTFSNGEATVTGGSGRVSWECPKVIVKDGQPWGLFQVSTDSVTNVYASASLGNADSFYYNNGYWSTDVYTVKDRKVCIPVTLNSDAHFTGRTTAMSRPYWIEYSYRINLTSDAVPTGEAAVIPEEYSRHGEAAQDADISDDSGSGGGQTDPVAPVDPSTPSDPTNPGDTTKPVTPSNPSALSDGTWKVKATTDRVMFYLNPKDTDPAEVILVKKGNSMTATFALSGEGYDYVYMGTPAQAKSAGIANWSKANIINGIYTFTVPVSALDKKLSITPHSKKYEVDADPSTDPWRPDKWIIFYSAGAVKVADGTTIAQTAGGTTKSASGRTNKKSKKQGKTKLKNKKKDKVSKWKDDSGKSTKAVNNKTSLKDGVYSPDRFSWSGGSGRLAYIRCTKITVKGGRSYATIEFSSTKYDSLKANGRVYSKKGGGNSTFTIPIKLNANNTIIGRTTAMSMPHWIKYNIFVYKKGATGGKGSSAEGDDGHVTSTKKLSDKAPDLLGLKVKKGKDVEKAEFFKIFRYEKGITLISIDQAQGTALYKKEEKNAGKKSGDATKKQDDEGTVEYDEDGKPIPKSQNEITAELYGNNVVNYLVVPKGVEVPAGLDKDCIIIQQPVKSTYVFDLSVMESIADLGVADKVSLIGLVEEDIRGAAEKALKAGKLKVSGDASKPDYAQAVKEKTDLALLPEEVLPEQEGQADSAEIEKKKKSLEILQKRFSALSVPMLIQRSGSEKSNYGRAEWIKVYGAIYGKDEEAKKIYQKYVKTHKEKKLKDETNDEK